MSLHSKNEMEILSSPTFQHIINTQLANPTRRNIIKGSMGAAALGFLGFAGNAGLGKAMASPGGNTQLNALGFASTPLSLADAVQLAEGYQFHVLYKLGDPISGNISAYANNGTDAANNPEEFQFRAGDHHDGMCFFGLGADNNWNPEVSDRGLLVINHEAITPLFLHANGPSSEAGVRDAKQALKEMYIHGVSVIEVQRGSNGQFSMLQNSSFNRRIHTFTEVEISGPLRGNAAMVTKFSPSGTRTRGTVNNCASGYTPWGTYLACEENWAGYFGNSNNAGRNANDQASMHRYSVRSSLGNGREKWDSANDSGHLDEPFGRWNIGITGATPANDYRNAYFTYGYNVEIDPFRPNSTPRKRTAMGRFAHEGAWLGPVEVGKPLVFYMGCDSRFEYVYKYVSAANWDPADKTRGLAAGDKYLDNGKLYVARFNSNFMGDWLDLATISAGTVLAKVRGSGTLKTAELPYTVLGTADQYLNTRILADLVGGTPMDRPEWGAVNPRNGEVYMTMTNNTDRTTVDAANPRAYFDNDTNTDGIGDAGSFGNINGHIIRWREAGSNPASTHFAWDVYIFAAESDDFNNPNVNLSGLTLDNAMSSPDGLWFSQKTGVLYIQTDDAAFTDTSNCMLLAAVPGVVGDGQSRTVINPNGAGTVTTLVGAVGSVRRLLVGPVDCEITGLTESPDGKALFINIQHPGESTANLRNPPLSSWPYPLAGGGFGNPAAGVLPNAGNRPRSATIVLTRIDGGLIGQ